MKPRCRVRINRRPRIVLITWASSVSVFPERLTRERETVTQSECRPTTCTAIKQESLENLEFLLLPFFFYRVSFERMSLPTEF